MFDFYFKEQEKTIERGRAKLQMPPVLAEAKENIEILEQDEMLSGYSSSKHLFIDISLGVPIRVRVLEKCIRNKKCLFHCRIV